MLFAASAYADPILGVPLSSFAILGGAGVTGTVPVNTIVGDLGACCSAVSVTGYPTAYSITDGTLYTGSGPASTAQNELSMAVTALEGLGPGANITAGVLGGLTLAPGVYSAPSTMNLTGTLTLDGYGNANALWVFLVPTSLTAEIGSEVVVENTGSGAGVYWVMESASATLNGATFEGNVLASQSITVGTSVTDSCGRLLTETGSVTLAGSDTIGIGCSDSLAGSNGLSGGGTLEAGQITPLPASTVPEPSLFWLLALCFAGLVTRSFFRSEQF